MKGVGGSLGAGVQPLVAAKIAGVDVTSGLGSDFVVARLLLATVRGVGADGAVVLDIGGKVVQATTSVPLTPGLGYEFVVAARSPRIVLKPTQQLDLPTLDQALARGVLGRAVPTLGLALEQGLRGLPRESGLWQGLARVAQIQQSLERGGLEPSALAEFYSRLGHDQEARVLQSRGKSALDLGLEMQRLRDTLKAQALQFLTRGGAGAEPHALARAEALVGALHGLESENARRAESGGLQVLPLPVAGGEVFREARLFFQVDDEADPPGSPENGAGGFTVVLLLDLSVLGAMRVDIELRGSAVGVVIHVADPEAGDLLRRALSERESELESEGLDVRRLQLRVSPSGVVPVADLLEPPASRDSASRVDVHA